MIDQLEAIGSKAVADVEAATTSDALEQIRVSVLGKKGELSQVLKGLAQVPADQRPVIGQKANEWKAKIESLLNVRREKLQEAELNKSLESDRIDVTLPSRLQHPGALHPITQTTQKVIQVFQRLGFEVTTGPEAETEHLNFEAVNIPKDHPARDMQDTFFLGPGVVLRSQTSPVQMRTMLKHKWPVRILCPGAVYRRDHDATHSPMFHQIEGLWVDRDVKMSDLKGVLEFFAKEIFGEKAQVRLRPSYFPFVEPGAEVDVSFETKRGVEWMEILGAGMVHPNLFKMAKYNPKDVTGFAFGIGIERIAMILHGITDIRLLYQGDQRFLRQFRK